MRLVTYHDNGSALRSGVLVGETVVDAITAASGLGDGAAEWAATVRGILTQDKATRDRLQQAAEAASAQGTPIGDLKLAPPIPDPSKCICIGINYRAHLEEAERIPGAPDSLPPVPIMFPMFKSSLVGHEGDIFKPATTQKLDWEVELGVVIGKTATKVSEADALDYVGGYMPINDVSARDLQLQGPQWTAGKAWDTSGPCGPAVVTADEVPDPQALRVISRLNGEKMQDSNTSLMINSVAQLIEYITSLITLEPGDLIATGTPEGAGVGREPQVWMNAGDVIEVEVEGLGVCRNTIR